MKLLESFVKSVLMEDLQGFLKDTQDIHFSPYVSADEKELASGGKDVKRIWAKNVDRKFIQSLVKVHWMTSYSAEKFASLVNSDGKDEISVMGYLPGSKLVSDWSDTGVIMDGYVTLAANDMNYIYSGYYTARDSAHAGSGMPKRPVTFKSDSHLAKSYILDRESFNPQMAKKNELLIDNWKVRGLILPLDSKGQLIVTSSRKPLIMEVAKAAGDLGVTIYNADMQAFTPEEVVNSAQI